MRSPGRVALVLLGAVAGPKPVPIRWIRVLRRLAWGRDPLFPRTKGVGGEALRHPVLGPALRDLELGTWAFGPSSLAYLERVVAELRPRVVLEFGSGISTVCIARYLADQDERGAAVGGRVISFEQSPDQAARTEELLARLGVADRTEVVVAPLRRRTVEGRLLSAYDLGEDDLEGRLRGERVDLVVVDGPAAEDGARYGTLPLVRAHLRPDALVLLDDALRDGELEVADGWSRLDYLEVEGIVPVEHGVLRVRAVAGGDP